MSECRTLPASLIREFLVDIAQAAEGAGWDGFFVWDHLTYRPPNRAAVDSWSVVAAVAAMTSRVRLGVLVTALARRDPAAFAQQVATIDLLSRGRVVVGAGLGSMPEELRRSVVAPTMLNARNVWTRHLKSSVISGAESLSVTTERARRLIPTVFSRLLRSDRSPVWIGGRWPNRSPFRRAARYDGVMPTHADYDHSSFMTTTELAEIVRFVHEHRENSSIDVVMEGHSVDGGHLAELARDYERVGLTWWIEKLGWWRGEPAAALAASCRRSAELGGMPRVRRTHASAHASWRAHVYSMASMTSVALISTVTWVPAS